MARKSSKPPKLASGNERSVPGADTAVDGPPEAAPALPFVVACAGASAGGLPALSLMLRALPADAGLALVIVQHLEPSHPSMLTEILARDTAMAVREVRSGVRIEPDHVYVIPPGKDLVMDGPRLRLAPRTSLTGRHRTIDHFMRSLAQAQADRAVGIVLSGTASDGTLGLQEIRAAGGITFAQDDTAEHNGMPHSAIAAGCVDFVLAPDRIGEELARISRHPYVAPAAQAGAATAAPAPDTEDITPVLDLLRRSTGVDFAHYKRNTLHRRIARRVVLHRLDSLADYVRFAHGEPGEAEALYQDVLINVTSFFRDPEAVDNLKRVVFPHLAAQKSRHEPVRTWVLGCSTGEEAYSLAMAYTEFMDNAGVSVPMQIFATDVNGTVIERARTGFYARGVAQDLSPERLRRFFTDVEGGYRVVKPLRDMCVFARQNALTDPPFSHMNLVACRNMLIYLDPVLQQKLVPVLHYALEPGGFLWLGNSESIGAHRELFDFDDPVHKLYRRKDGPGRRRVPSLQKAPVPTLGAPGARTRAAKDAEPHREADRLLLARYSPPGVVVDGDMNVLQFRGDTGPYLTPAPGSATFNLPKMLREGLLAPVRNALRKAQRLGATVREENLQVRSNGGHRGVNLVVLPIKPGDASGGVAVVLFEEPSRQAEGRARQAEGRAHRAAAQARAQQDKVTAGDTVAVGTEIARLQSELAETREYLESVTAQYQTTTEELQSANEEVQSANEELQSANEELETSREEIQSSNEELATVNEELQRRNEDLEHANNDLLNLIGSVQMPIVILGPDLRIRRFTPAAERVLSLIPADVGRPIADIRFKFDVPQLEALVLEVIETVAVKEFEVQDPQGRWYLLRIRPYKTVGSRIDGAVLVLVDVDTIKRAEQDLRESDKRKNDFLALLSHELRTPLAALRSAAQVIGTLDAPTAALEQARSVLGRQTLNMGRMVNDLLDVARVSHGTIQLRPVPTDLLDAVRHAVDATSHERGANGQKLTLSLPTRPLRVMADPVRLDQVFGNLLINASKFTPRDGQIWVAAQQEPSTASATSTAGYAVVTVRDDGIGIEAAALPRVFSAFREMGRAPAHAQRGMGLGLTLAQTLVGLHGGTIEARSEGADCGSEFVVRLPLMPALAPGEAAAAPRPAEAPVAVTPRRILVVDDNADAASIMRVLLELDGHQVETAHDGRGALAAAVKRPPEIVLLDLGMPGMDGYAIARALRAEPGLKTVTIIAVTGYAREDDKRRTSEAGFDHHLAKPVERRTLQELFARVPRQA